MLPGTAGARQPFFSPDGRQVAFFSDNQLKRLLIGEEAPHPICPAYAPRGGSWGDDDFIVLGTKAQNGLSRVPASGGKAEAFTFIDSAKHELNHRFPRVLPGGSAVLFTATLSRVERSVAVQRSGSREHTTVVEHAEAPQYAHDQLFYRNEQAELMEIGRAHV